MHEELKKLVDWIEQSRPQRVVALTGAGISAESGIPTFRGAGGLWENFRAEDLATPQAFSRDPQTVWRWYEWRRGLVREAQPNAAHVALAKLEQVQGIELSVVTQNVDGLHRRAGSKNVVEIHGNITEVRCLREGDVRDADHPLEELPPKCECGAMLRPNVVWFGEMLPPGAWERAVELTSDADLALVIGTSGLVYPAAGLVGYCEGKSAEVNPDATRASSQCDFILPMRAGEAVPLIVDAIERAVR